MWGEERLPGGNGETQWNTAQQTAGANRWEPKRRQGSNVGATARGRRQKISGGVVWVWIGKKRE